VLLLQGLVVNLLLRVLHLCVLALLLGGRGCGPAVLMLLLLACCCSHKLVEATAGGPAEAFENLFLDCEQVPLELPAYTQAAQMNRCVKLAPHEAR
jgi:hypothetical protein